MINKNKYLSQNREFSDWARTKFFLQQKQAVNQLKPFLNFRIPKTPPFQNAIISNGLNFRLFDFIRPLRGGKYRPIMFGLIFFPAVDRAQR